MVDFFSGVRINVVEAGTVVGYDRDGNAMVVTDECTVLDGQSMWVTQKVYDKLKEASQRPINWRDDHESVVEDDEPMIGRDYE